MYLIKRDHISKQKCMKCQSTNAIYVIFFTEISSVDQNELFRVDDETNPKSKAVCAVHKTTGTWQCIMNCVVVIPDEEDVQMRQQRFKSW